MATGLAAPQGLSSGPHLLVSLPPPTHPYTPLPLAPGAVPSTGFLLCQRRDHCLSAAASPCWCCLCHSNLTALPCQNSLFRSIASVCPPVPTATPSSNCVSPGNDNGLRVDCVPPCESTRKGPPPVSTAGRLRSFCTVASTRNMCTGARCFGWKGMRLGRLSASCNCSTY